VPRIFISYRRSDSAAVSGRIYDRLCLAFGEPNVFKDVDDIPAGAHYRELLETEVGKCDVLLAIIGAHWLTVTNEQGQRRLDNPHDFVRIEIEAGLKRQNALVIPLLVDEARMPSPEELPEGLRDLHFRNAAAVRNDPDFNRDVGRLIQTIRDYYPPTDQELAALANPQPPPAASPARAQQKFVLPWMGILVGVLLVITLLAAIRLIDRAVTNTRNNNATATAIVLTSAAQASASASLTPAP
jgi:hypothetical protein